MLPFHGPEPGKPFPDQKLNINQKVDGLSGTDMKPFLLSVER